MKEQVAAGVDIGGTNTEIGLVTRKGEVVFSKTIPTTGHDSPETYTQLIGSILKQAAAEKNLDIIAVGAGAPSANFFSGCIEHAPNMPWTGIIPLAELLGKSTGSTCYVTNDANAAAIGEMIFGKAKELKDFVVVTLGTGLGSGFVVNGELIYGHDGFAGELGHVIIDENGRQCGCGRKGCLETYVSATGVVWSAKELLNQGKNISGVDPAKFTSKDITDAADKGDKEALVIIDKTARQLGLALANAVAITSPSHIFLYGGVARSGDTLLIPVKQYFDHYVLRNYAGKVSIEISGLPENAAVLGAAALAWKEHSKIS